MYGTLPLSGPGDGFFPPSIRRFKFLNNTAATAFVQGTIVMADIQQASPTPATSFAPGHATAGVNDSVFNTVILPTAAGLLAGNPLFVSEGPCAALAVGSFTLMDVAAICRIDGTTPATKGCALIANTTGNLVITPGTTTGAAIVGYLMSASSVSTVTNATVWFNGYGFKTSAT